MPFDLKSWLNDLAANNALSEEDRTLLEEKLGRPDVLKRLEEKHLDGLRQSDYDRKMNQLKGEHETEMNKVTTIQQQLVQWKADAEKQLADAKGNYERELAVRAQLEARLRTLAQDYGLDLKDLLPDAGPAPAPAPTAAPSPAPAAQPASDDFKKFRDDFDQARTIFPLLPAEIYDLAVEHQTLFGGALAKTKELVAKAMEEKRPLREVWEEQYKVSDRRKELATEREQAREAEIRKDEREKTLSEMNVPTLRPDAPRSPIFSAIPQKEAPTGGEPKQRELSAVDKAALAYEQGKYRPNA